MTGMRVPYVADKFCLYRTLRTSAARREMPAQPGNSVPSWIAQQLDKLRMFREKQKTNDGVGVALGILNGPGSRGQFCQKGENMS